MTIASKDKLEDLVHASDWHRSYISTTKHADPHQATDGHGMGMLVLREYSFGMNSAADVVREMHRTHVRAVLVRADEEYPRRDTIGRFVNIAPLYFLAGYFLSADDSCNAFGDCARSHQQDALSQRCNVSCQTLIDRVVCSGAHVRG